MYGIVQIKRVQGELEKERERKRGRQTVVETHFRLRRQAIKQANGWTVKLKVMTLFFLSETSNLSPVLIHVYLNPPLISTLSFAVEIHFRAQLACLFKIYAQRLSRWIEALTLWVVVAEDASTWPICYTENVIAGVPRRP